MSESSLATVRQLFERFDPERLEAALELVSEDFVAEIPGSMSAEPDVYEGHDGARRYFAGFDGLIEVEQHAAVVTRVKDGKVTGMEPYPDVETARQALLG